MWDTPMDSWVEYVICPNIGHGNTGTRTRGGHNGGEDQCCQHDNNCCQHDLGDLDISVKQGLFSARCPCQIEGRTQPEAHHSNPRCRFINGVLPSGLVKCELSTQGAWSEDTSDGMRKPFWKKCYNPHNLKRQKNISFQNPCETTKLRSKKPQLFPTAFVFMKAIHSLLIGCMGILTTQFSRGKNK